jgi:hypothetical protein
VEITHHCHPLHKRTGSFLFSPGRPVASLVQPAHDPSSPPVRQQCRRRHPSLRRPRSHAGPRRSLPDSAAATARLLDCDTSSHRMALSTSNHGAPAELNRSPSASLHNSTGLVQRILWARPLRQRQSKLTPSAPSATQRRCTRSRHSVWGKQRAGRRAVRGPAARQCRRCSTPRGLPRYRRS